MDSQWTIADDVVKLLHTEFTSIIAFHGTPRNKTALVNCEHECVEEFLIFAIEGDIYEYALGKTRHSYRFLAAAFFEEALFPAYFFTASFDLFAETFLPDAF